MPSSVIHSFAYDPATRELRVRFVTGRNYLYLDVPPDEVDRWKTSGSLGRYFNRRIRDHYRYRELQRSDRA